MAITDYASLKTTIADYLHRSDLSDAIIANFIQLGEVRLNRNLRVLQQEATATLTLSAAQTLESGETLTFDGAGRTVTISGNVEIKKVGEAAAQISFDLEKFLTAVDESYSKKTVKTVTIEIQ